jgi:hypothetical protein
VPAAGPGPWGLLNSMAPCCLRHLQRLGRGPQAGPWGLLNSMAPRCLRHLQRLAGAHRRGWQARLGLAMPRRQWGSPLAARAPPLSPLPPRSCRPGPAFFLPCPQLLTVQEALDYTDRLLRQLVRACAITGVAE